MYADEGITVKLLRQADGSNLSKLISDLDSDSHNGIAAQSRGGVGHLPDIDLEVKVDALHPKKEFELIP